MSGRRESRQAVPTPKDDPERGRRSPWGLEREDTVVTVKE
jgi:hypothetical protein